MYVNLINGCDYNVIVDYEWYDAHAGFTRYSTVAIFPKESELIVAAVGSTLTVYAHMKEPIFRETGTSTATATSELHIIPTEAPPVVCAEHPRLLRLYERAQSLGLSRLAKQIARICEFLNRL